MNDKGLSFLSRITENLESQCLNHIAGILRVYVDVCKTFQCVLKGSCDQHNVIARNMYKNCEAIKGFLAGQLLHKKKNKANYKTPNLLRLSP